LYILGWGNLYIAASAGHKYSERPFLFRGKTGFACATLDSGSKSSNKGGSDGGRGSSSCADGSGNC